jgi:hypothetical protein
LGEGSFALSDDLAVARSSIPFSQTVIGGVAIAVVAGLIVVLIQKRIFEDASLPPVTSERAEERSTAVVAPRSLEPKCGDVLTFLRETGAFGSKPVQERAYARNVQYYDKGIIDRAQVLSIARAYEARFPVRIYEIDDSKASCKEISEALCYCHFEYKYNTKNSKRERFGTAFSEFRVRGPSGDYAIVSERGNILTRTVRELK